MTWILWAALLLTHGALTRWAKGLRYHTRAARFFAPTAIVADGILIAIALITMDQLQGLGFADVVRVGIFFVAFGTAGRQLMDSVLSRS
jgi:hypothetical protein